MQSTPPESPLLVTARRRWRKVEAVLQARPLLWALVVSTALAAVFVLTLSPGYATNDDVAMQAVADGTLGEPVPHLVFSNVLIGLLLNTLYRAAPWVPWYGLYLYLAHFAALVAIVYVVLTARQGRLWMRLLGLLAVLTVFHLAMCMQLQFTSTGILLGASGVALFLATSDRALARYGMPALGGAMVGFASWIRWSALQAVIVLALPVVVLSLRRIPWRRQALFASTALLIVLTGWVAQSAYYADRADWQAYFDFNAIRGRLEFHRDLTTVDKEVLAEVGWTRNDLSIFRTWFFTDENVHQIEDLEVLADALPSSFRWMQARQALIDQGQVWPGALRLGTLALLGAVACSGGDWRTRILVPVSLVTVGVTMFALAGTARLPDRVALPMLAFPALLFLAAPDFGARAEAPRPAWSRRIGSALAVALLVSAAAVGVGHAVGLDRRHEQSAAQLDSLLARFEETNPDGLFISWGGELPLSGQSVSPWHHVRRSGPELIGLGWQQRSPLHNDLLAGHESGDLYAAVANRTDVYLPLRDTRKGVLLRRYLEEHYGFSGLLRPAARAGPFTVYDLIVAYQVRDDAAMLVEHRMDGTRLSYPLRPADGTGEATVVATRSGEVMITGRAEADLIVITRKGEGIKVVLPHRTHGEAGPADFRVAVRAAKRSLRVFALFAGSATELKL